MFEQRRKTRFIECVEDALADPFPQPRAIVKQGLRVGAELILACLPKMPPIERREIRIRMKHRDDQGAVGMERSVPFPQGRKRRRDVRE